MPLNEDKLILTPPKIPHWNFTTEIRATNRCRQCFDDLRITIFIFFLLSGTMCQHEVLSPKRAIIRTFFHIFSKVFARGNVRSVACSRAALISTLSGSRRSDTDSRSFGKFCEERCRLFKPGARRENSEPERNRCRRRLIGGNVERGKSKKRKKKLGNAIFSSRGLIQCQRSP